MVQINKDPPFFGRSSDWFTGGGKDAMVSTIDFPFNQSIVPLFVCPPKCIWYHLMVKSENSQQKRMSWDLFDKTLGNVSMPHEIPCGTATCPAGGCLWSWDAHLAALTGAFLLLNFTWYMYILYIYIHGFLLRLWAEHNIPWHNTHYTHYMNALFSEHAWTCMKQFSETSPLGPIPSFPSTECLLADAFIDLDVHCRLIVLVGGEDLWLLRGNHLGVAARARTRKVNGTDWLEVPIPYIRPIYSIYKAHVRGYP